MNKFPIDKLDLCAQEVRVSAEGLSELAAIALVRSCRDLENALRKIQTHCAHDLPAENHYHMVGQAEDMAEAAKDLKIALSYLHAFRSLKNGERSELNLYPQR